jgi:hypothetical protein
MPPWILRCPLAMRPRLPARARGKLRVKKIKVGKPRIWNCSIRLPNLTLIFMQIYLHATHRGKQPKLSGKSAAVTKQIDKIHSMYLHRPRLVSLRRRIQNRIPAHLHPIGSSDHVRTRKPLTLRLCQFRRPLIKTGAYSRETLICRNLGFAPPSKPAMLPFHRRLLLGLRCCGTEHGRMGSCLVRKFDLLHQVHSLAEQDPNRDEMPRLTPSFSVQSNRSGTA